MRSLPLVSVIVPTYNRRESVCRTLSALNAQTACGESYEVIVVDDGSDDGTVSELARYGESMRYLLRVVLNPRGGPASARNAGLRLAEGAVVLFTDSDCEPDPNWVSSMVSCLAAGAQAAGGLVEAPRDAPWFARCVNHIMHTALGGMGRKWRLWASFPGTAFAQAIWQ